MPTDRLNEHINIMIIYYILAKTLDRLNIELSYGYKSKGFYWLKKCTGSSEFFSYFLTLGGEPLSVMSEKSSFARVVCFSQSHTVHKYYTKYKRNWCKSTLIAMVKKIPLPPNAPPFLPPEGESLLKVKSDKPLPPFSLPLKLIPLFASFSASGVLGSHLLKSRENPHRIRCTIC